MSVHRVSGRYLRDALERAQRAYGGDALVVSQRTGELGGVTLAVTDEAPRSAVALARLKGEAEELLAREDAPVRPARPSTADVERCLVRTGASPELVQRIASAVAARLEQGELAHPLDLAGEQIAKSFATARRPRVPGKLMLIALLGPAGAGKTTCAAKLAARWKRPGTSVALASLDAHRIGMVEQMRALGERLGVSTAVFQDGLRLARALDNDRAPAIVVLEGSARPERDLEELERFERAAADRGVPAHVERYLVLPATADDELLERTSSIAPADGCGITMLDQTARPARVLELAARAGLAVAFLAHGPELGDLARPSAECFADLLLRGRIA